MAFLPLLFRIQELDSKAIALKRTLEQAALNPNLLALESLLQQSKASLIKVKNARRELNSSQRQLELELKTCQEHLEHEEKKLYDGTVVSSRGLEQVQQKAAEYKKQQVKLEDQILVFLEEDEKLAVNQADLEKRLIACEKELEIIQKDIKQQSGAIALEQNEINLELEELRPQIPTEWLERYQRIAKAHLGIGIAKIKTDSCGACHVGLSDALMRKAKQGEDTLIFCENCGRILYY
jgi:predicted  nucleic acid-binding Zn-ribbon protein